MPTIKISQLSKYFGVVKAVDNIDLVFQDGKLSTLLGPSGCGKTTILRCIAGLEKPDKGEIWIGNTLVSSSEKNIFVQPERRDVGMVFQSYAVWPHFTVYENVVYPLKTKKTPRDTREKLVKEALEMVRLDQFEKRYPSQLSGGQQQRVALARALVYRPKILLLDEPLSNLDAKLRETTRFELKKLQCSLGITTVYVTHSQAEALVLSDQIFLMNVGKIIQKGDPETIYMRPANDFAADFIGKANFLNASVVEFAKADLCIAETEHGERIMARCDESKMKILDEVLVVIRPESVKITTKRIEKEPNTFESKIEEVIYLGNYFEYRVLLGNQILQAISPLENRYKVGDKIFIQISPENCLIVPKEKS